MSDLESEIAEELKAEEEARVMAEFAPKGIQRSQVKGAKWAWMSIAVGIDLVTAYAYTVILAPYWWYAVIWIIAGAGGLLFAEWLWERIGNNEEQTRLANTSKIVSAIAVLVMALLAGLALVSGWKHEMWMEDVALLSAIGLVCFHGWQSYQYHEKDDDYIAATEAAREDARNKKEIQKIHRAGQRVAAKKVVHTVGAKYQKQHGQAFVAAAGRSYADQTVAQEFRPEQPPRKVWRLAELLDVLGFDEKEARAAVKKVNNPDEFYNMLKGYGIENVDISRKNFAKLFYELKQANPQTPPRNK